MAFIDDIQSRDTALYPVVIFETSNTAPGDIQISTKPVSIGHRTFTPLLLSSPSIKESIDLENRRYKISNVSLKVSNVEYNGGRFSDKISLHEKGGAINTQAAIYWISPSVESENILFDLDSGNAAYFAYKGVVRSITHDEKTCNITLEDISQSTLHRDVPVALLTGDGILEKYLNKPYPMVYGEVDKSPCIVSEVTQDIMSDFNILPDRVLDDNITIEGIQRFTDINWDGGASRYSDLMVRSDVSYCYVLNTTIYSQADGLYYANQYFLGDTNQYIISNSEIPIDPDIATNTIAQNIVQVYEVDSTINQIKFVDFTWVLPSTFDETLIISPFPAMSWEDEDYVISFLDEDENVGNDWRFGVTKLTFNTTSAFDDYPIREALSFGNNSHITTTVESLEGDNPYFMLACKSGVGQTNDLNFQDPESGNLTIMQKWDTDIDIDGMNWYSDLGGTVNLKKYISSSIELYSGDGTIWYVYLMSNVKEDLSEGIGSKSTVSTFQNSMSALKVYYLDKFTTRNFYAHVKGRVTLQ